MAKFYLFFITLLFITSCGSTKSVPDESQINQSSNRNIADLDYDGSGDGVFGRKIIKRNWRGLFNGNSKPKGNQVIAVKICIDPKGMYDIPK